MILLTEKIAWPDGCAKPHLVMHFLFVLNSSPHFHYRAPTTKGETAFSWLWFSIERVIQCGLRGLDGETGSLLV
jgi:hypothetical protein